MSARNGNRPEKLPVLAPNTALDADGARTLTEEVKRDAATLWTSLLRLYEGGAHTALGYSSWPAYCAAEFDMGRSRAYQILDAAKVIEALPESTMVDSRRIPAPQSERVARELAPLRDEPDTLRQAWQEIADERGEQVTAELVREAVQDRLRQARKAEGRCKRDARRQAERDANAVKVQSAGSLEDAVADGAKFSTVVVDPPWCWGDEGDVDQHGRARPTYETWSLERLRDELPIAAVADDDAHLYLWITNRSLPKGFGLLEGWGFRYVTAITWVKPSFGMGNYFRGQTEHVLFAVRGSLPLARKDVGTVLHAPRPAGRLHSAKPDEFYSLIESCSPAPRIDIFGRRERDGWSVWGEGGLS